MADITIEFWSLAELTIEEWSLAELTVVMWYLADLTVILWSPRARVWLMVLATRGDWYLRRPPEHEN